MDFSIAGILLLDGSSNGAIYALLALAIVLIFAVTRVIFVPQGEFAAYGALTLAMLQLDRVPTGSTSIETRLFDAPFFVPAGPFLLAGLARVPLVPVFSARTGFFSRRIEVGRAVSPPRRPTPAELERLAAAAVAQMEEHIRVYPTQWFHFGTEPHEGN